MSKLKVSKIKVKTCPFCNSKRVNLHYSRYNNFYWLECDRYGCRAESGCSDTQSKAIKKWNNRHSSFESAKLNTELALE